MEKLLALFKKKSLVAILGTFHKIVDDLNRLVDSHTVDMAKHTLAADEALAKVKSLEADVLQAQAVVGNIKNLLGK